MGALLTASVAGFGGMMWYYQGAMILASDSATIQNNDRKRRKKEKSESDLWDCVPDCTPNWAILCEIAIVNQTAIAVVIDLIHL